MARWINRTLASAGRMLPARWQRRASATADVPAAPSPEAQRDAFYAAAVNSSNLAFLTTDIHGLLTSWNPGAERLFGFSAKEAIGRDIESLVPPARQDEVELIRKKFRTGQRVERFSTIRVGKDGRPVHVVFDIAPIKTSGEEPSGFSAVVRDVTEQRLGEELLGLAVEACPSGMMMVDRGGYIIMVNSEIERLFRYPREELLGQSVELLVPKESSAIHAKLRSNFNKRPQNRRMGKNRELVGLRKDGIEFPVEIELNTIQYREGLLTLAVVLDISARKRTERLKDEFVSTVSHELRTPLTSITASLALLTAGKAGELPPPALRLVAIAHNNGQRLVRLVNDILDMEKIELGKLAFNFQPVSARDVAKDVIESSRHYAEEVGVKVRLDSASMAGDVWVDSDRLAQVVTNLLSNAIKFSPAGEDVIVAVGERDDMVRITVRDHGPGISEEFKPRVFEKFAQADGSDTRQKGGTGLGLNIVKQIVTRMGGEVGFDSELGRGALFFVELPREAAGEMQQADAAKEMSGIKNADGYMDNQEVA